MLSFNYFSLMIDEEFSRASALLIIRLTAGILFFFQAYDKIFKMGLQRVAGSLPSPPPGLSQKLIFYGVSVSSFIELAGGILLVMGLLSSMAAVVLGLNMVAVAFVFSSMRPMWDMQFFLPRLILLLLILLLPQAWDAWSLDNYLNN